VLYVWPSAVPSPRWWPRNPSTRTPWPPRVNERKISFLRGGLGRCSSASSFKAAQSPLFRSVMLLGKEKISTPTPQSVYRRSHNANMCPGATLGPTLTCGTHHLGMHPLCKMSIKPSLWTSGVQDSFRDVSVSRTLVANGWLYAAAVTLSVRVASAKRRGM